MGRVNESPTSDVNAKVKIKAVVASAVKGEVTTLNSALIRVQIVYEEAFQRAGPEY